MLDFCELKLHANKNSMRGDLDEKVDALLCYRSGNLSIKLGIC